MVVSPSSSLLVLVFFGFGLEDSVEVLVELVLVLVVVVLVVVVDRPVVDCWSTKTPLSVVSSLLPSSVLLSVVVTS